MSIFLTTCHNRWEVTNGISSKFVLKAVLELGFEILTNNLNKRYAVR